jgi:glyoxylate reductase
MDKKKVFITRLIPESALALLERHFHVGENKKAKQLTKREIIMQIKGAFGLLSLLTDPIDKQVISTAPNLRIIANYAVGYDNIDVSFATERGIIVTNTPGVLTGTTAELAWALLFSVARRIVEGDTFAREGLFDGWAPTLLLGYDIAGKTLGIVGAGRIGTAFAMKSRGFNMEILYFDPKKNPAIEKKLGARKVSLRTLLKRSDFISIHVPLTNKTYHLIGKQELASMKPTAILINTSRGAIVDEKALAHALAKRLIAGAGLDVFEQEPAITKKLLTRTNVVLTPHIGSASVETRERMALMAAQSIIDVWKNRIPKNIVNRDALKRIHTKRKN